MGAAAQKSLAWVDVPRFTYDLMPDQTRTSLRWANEFAVTWVGAGVGGLSVGANMLVDPGSTSANDAYEFTQWCSLYNYFHVIRSTIRYHITPYVANTSPCYVWTWLDSHYETVLPGGISTALNMGFDTNQIKTAYIMTTHGEDAPQKLSTHYDFTVDSGEPTYMSGLGSNWAGTAGAVPADPIIQVPYMLTCTGGAGTAGGLYIVAQMDSDVVFYGRRPPGA